MHNSSFLYFVVPGKSVACQLETLLINQLPTQGFQLTNVADGKHRNFGTSEIPLDSVSLHRWMQNSISDIFLKLAKLVNGNVTSLL